MTADAKAPTPTQKSPHTRTTKAIVRRADQRSWPASGALRAASGAAAETPDVIVALMLSSTAARWRARQGSPPLTRRTTEAVSGLRRARRMRADGFSLTWLYINFELS